MEGEVLKIKETVSDGQKVNEHKITVIVSEINDLINGRVPYTAKNALDTVYNQLVEDSLKEIRQEFKLDLQKATSKADECQRNFELAENSIKLERSLVSELKQQLNETKIRETKKDNDIELVCFFFTLNFSIKNKIRLTIFFY